MGDERICLKSRRTASFKKHLSIEPNFNLSTGSISLDRTFKYLATVLTSYGKLAVEGGAYILLWCIPNSRTNLSWMQCL
jgi:hypothetical protein